MARNTFAGRPGDFVTQPPSGNANVVKIAPNIAASGTFWSVEVGGTQYTDLLNSLGNPIAGLSTSSEGRVVAFQGPNNIQQGWADFGSGRFLLDSQQVADPVTAIAANLSVGGSATRGVLDPLFMPDGGVRPVGKGELMVNVKDYGAAGDGSTVDTTAISNAIAAAGASGRLYFPPGRYLTGPLTMLSAQTWTGPTTQVGFSTTPCELVFTGLTGSQVGIAMATSCTLENLRLVGPGATVGTCTGITSASPTARFRNVQTWKWNTGVFLNAVWYATMRDCEFRWNSTGLAITNCYNLNLTNPMFNCNIDGGANFGTAIAFTSSCMVNLHGGSVESYGTQSAPGIKMSSSSILACFGTYFESVAANAVGILVDSLTGVAVTLTGLQVYLDNHTNWFQGWAGSPTGTVTSRGCRFIGASTATNPIAFAWASPSTLSIDVAGDDWSGVTNAASLYRRELTVSPDVRIRDPHTTAGSFVRKSREYNGRSIVQDSTSWVATGAGLTANRPTGLVTGSQWYDATLGKPIWWNGTVWKDAAGTTV